MRIHRQYGYILIAFTLMILFHSVVSAQLRIVPGAERTMEYFSLIKNKNIAIVANQTSIIGNTHLVDSLLAAGMKIKCVFAPEHGFRGEAEAGEVVNNSKDRRTAAAGSAAYPIGSAASARTRSAAPPPETPSRRH